MMKKKIYSNTFNISELLLLTCEFSVLSFVATDETLVSEYLSNSLSEHLLSLLLVSVKDEESSSSSGHDDDNITLSLSLFKLFSLAIIFKLSFSNSSF